MAAVCEQWGWADGAVLGLILVPFPSNQGEEKVKPASYFSLGRMEVGLAVYSKFRRHHPQDTPHTWKGVNTVGNIPRDVVTALSQELTYWHGRECPGRRRGQEAKDCCSGYCRVPPRPTLRLTHSSLQPLMADSSAESLFLGHRCHAPNLRPWYPASNDWSAGEF